MAYWGSSGVGSIEPWWRDERDEKPECCCKCHNHPDHYEHRECLLCGHKAPYLCETSWSENYGPSAGPMVVAPVA